MQQGKKKKWKAQGGERQDTALLIDNMLQTQKAQHNGLTTVNTPEWAEPDDKADMQKPLYFYIPAIST